jgi:hypothetical protein
VSRDGEESTPPESFRRLPPWLRPVRVAATARALMTLADQNDRDGEALVTRGLFEELATNTCQCWAAHGVDGANRLMGEYRRYCARLGSRKADERFRRVSSRLGNMGSRREAIADLTKDDRPCVEVAELILSYVQGEKDYPFLESLQFIVKGWCEAEALS